MMAKDAVSFTNLKIGEYRDSSFAILQDQTARGHPTLKGWGMLRAARFG